MEEKESRFKSHFVYARNHIIQRTIDSLNLIIFIAVASAIQEDAILAILVPAGEPLRVYHVFGIIIALNVFDCFLSVIRCGFRAISDVSMDTYTLLSFTAAALGFGAYIFIQGFRTMTTIYVIVLIVLVIELVRYIRGRKSLEVVDEMIK